MGYLVVILSGGRAPQVVILSGAPAGAESKDPVRRQQKTPPSSTPRTCDRPPGSGTEKHRPTPPWQRSHAMHDSSPSSFLATWTFLFRPRKRPPKIVHNARSLPSRATLAFPTESMRAQVRQTSAAPRPNGGGSASGQSQAVPARFEDRSREKTPHQAFVDLCCRHSKTDRHERNRHEDA